MAFRLTVHCRLKGKQGILDLICLPVPSNFSQSKSCWGLSIFHVGPAQCITCFPGSLCPADITADKYTMHHVTQILTIHMLMHASVLYMLNRWIQHLHLTRYVGLKWRFNKVFQSWISFSKLLQSKALHSIFWNNRHLSHFQMYLGQTYFPLLMDGKARDFKFLLSAKVKIFFTALSRLCVAFCCPHVWLHTWITYFDGNFLAGHIAAVINLMRNIYFLLFGTSH